MSDVRVRGIVLMVFGLVLAVVGLVMALSQVVSWWVGGSAMLSGAALVVTGDTLRKRHVDGDQ